MAEKDLTFEPRPGLLKVEAVLLAAMLITGSLILTKIDWQTTQVAAPPPKVKTLPGDLIEADALVIANRSGDFNYQTQDTSAFTHGEWSQNLQLFVQTTSPGQSITLVLPERTPGSYDLAVYLTKSYDYGIVQFSLNGADVGRPVDGWANQILTTGAIPLGPVTLKQGENTLTVKVVGHNPSSTAPHYYFGFDALTLRPRQ